MTTSIRLLLCFLTLSGFARAANEEPFPISLVEVAPTLGFLQQNYSVAGNSYFSNANPGGVVRFTPIWRGKFPITIHLGATQLYEQNNAGVTVDGEHGPLKYIWSFGTRFQFRPLSRFLAGAGMEFNHEPYFLDEGNQHVFLNKVLVPTLVFSGSWEWWKEERFSGLLDGGVKLAFTVPMDDWLLRNGLVLFAQAGGRWKLDSDFTLFAKALLERRAYNSTLGDFNFVNVALEVGVGWGDGT